MEIFEKLLQKTVVFKGKSGTYRAKKLMLCQFCRYRKTVERLDALRENSLNANYEIDELRSEIIQTLAFNFRDKFAKEELVHLDLSETLDLCSFLISGIPDGGETEKALLKLDIQTAIIDIVQHFPAYRLEDFTFMTAEEFHQLHLLIRMADGVITASNSSC